MNFRRVMLVVLPLLAAVFLYMVLGYVYREWERSLVGEGGDLPASPEEEAPRGQAEMKVGDQEMGHVVSEDVDLVRKDADGRVVMHLKADRILHQTRETADITRPRVRYFTKDGEVITISCQKARAVTEGQLIDLEDVRTGRLWENVVLSHDRGTPDDFSDDLLVGLEYLDFDNEQHTLTTEGPVILVGPEVDLTAVKMQMTLDASSRRVETMTFFRDVAVSMEAGDRLQMGLVGTSEEVPSEVDEAGEGVREGPVAGAATGAGSGRTGAEAPSGGTPAAEAVGGKRDGAVLWRIEIFGKVQATQLDQRLTGEYVSLYNETAREAAGPQSDEPAAVGAASAAPTAAGEGAAARSAPGAVTDETWETGGVVETAPEWMRPDAAPPLTVVADGPLVVTPVGPEEQAALGDRRYEVTATGRPVVVEDGQVRVTGTEVRYNLKTESGSVAAEDSDVTLDEPDRLHLSGGRLAFDRGLGTADVYDRVRLVAYGATEALTGGVGTASGTAAPSRLDASARDRMHLAFHRLPQGGSGRPEARRAEFYGDAVVRHKDGVLKGNELAIDFFRADARGSQDIERLVGKGNVYVEDRRGGGGEGTGSGGGAPGRIACQDLDMRFGRGEEGGTEPKRLEAHGDVAIDDSEGGTVRAGDLTARFGRDEKGEIEIVFFDAYRNVVIDRKDMYAEGDHVKRDLQTGEMVLEGNPARARQGDFQVVGPHVEYQGAKGQASVTGAGMMQVPATTDLRGRAREAAAPLVIEWSRRMYFEEARNFAHFDGDVNADTEGSHLESRRLWVYFKDAPKGDSSGVSRGDEDASGMGKFFQDKAVERVFAEEDVRAVDVALARDGTIDSRMEIVGENLTYVEAKRTAYVRKPGQLYFLGRERSDTAGAPGLNPDAFTASWTGPVPRAYSRTTIAWNESMVFEGTSNRAFFRGDVRAVHVGRGMPGEGSTSRGRQTTTRVRSGDLLAVFSERAGGAGESESSQRRSEQMEIDKLIATQDVRLWADERRGSGGRLIYDRTEDVLRLLAGEDGWARMWREDEATQQFDEVIAREIRYWPSSDHVRLVQPRTITISQTP